MDADRTRVKKKNKHLRQRPVKTQNLPPARNFPFSTTPTLIGSSRPDNTADTGAGRKAEYSINVYENPAFRLCDEDIDRPRPSPQPDFTSCPSTERHVKAHKRTSDISFVVRDTMTPPPPLPARRADTSVLIQVNDRTPLQPRRHSHGTFNKIWNLLCWKQHVPISKEQISWPVIGSLVVRGPEGELEDALIDLSVRGMLHHVIRTESDVPNRHILQGQDTDDIIFRRISKRQHLQSNLPLTTATTKRILRHRH